MEPTTIRTQVQKKNQITIPQQVRRALHLREGDEVEFTVSPKGDVSVRGMTAIPSDQKWFWSEEWQRGEREATRAIDAGDTTFYSSGEELLEHLEELSARD